MIITYAFVYDYVQFRQKQGLFWLQ